MTSENNESISFPLIILNLNQGLPQSGKNSWKMIFFQVREKSGNFVDDQGNLVRTWEVKEKSGNLKINGYGRHTSENVFILFKSKFFHLRVTPKFEVIQLAPLN